MQSKAAFAILLAGLAAAVAAAPGAACPVGFSYDASADPAGQVLVTGTFCGWSSSPPQAWEMTDDNHDQIWEASGDLPIETYLYKFIVDGEWIADPANPEQEPDGFGGFHSILDVTCSEPFFQLLAHQSDEAQGTFYAGLLFVPTLAALDPASVAVTVDHQNAPPGSLQVTGDQVIVTLRGLTAGIHDLRVAGADLAGRPARTSLLKVYQDETRDWSDVILYFVLTDRFRNGDPSNDDPIPGLPEQTNYRGGDFQGVIDAIEEGYFDELGVNALWLSWVGDNPGEAETGFYYNTDDCGLPGSGYPTVPVGFAGYHGYWPRHLLQVEEHFGDLAKLQELVHAAHARGIRVLLDLTINHVHADSPFFTDHPRSFFNFPMEICEEIGWSRPETCWFTSFLPDVRYQDERAGRAVLRNAAWWIEATGCDGFRVDALKHIYFGFISDLREFLDATFAQTGVPFYLVGETFSGSSADVAAYIGPDLAHGQFDFPLNLSLLRSLATEEDGLDTLYSNTRAFQDAYYDAYPDAVMSTFLGNHDIARFVSLAAGDLYCPIWDNVAHASQGWRHPPGVPSAALPYAKLKLAFTYLMTIPGIPLIYYGDEYGQPGAGDPDNRRPMVFADGLTPLQTETLDHVAELGRIRTARESLRARHLTSALWSSPTFLAYSRVTLAERAVVALNRSSAGQTQRFSVLGTGLVDGDELTDELGGSPVTVAGGQLEITLEPYAAAIYVFEVPGTPTPVPTGAPSPTPTPAPTGRSLALELEGDGHLEAGELFRLTLAAANQDEPVLADIYVLLEAYGSYFFWPAWTAAVQFRSEALATGEVYQETVLEFVWPAGAASGQAAFWGALFASGGYDLLADPAHVPFDWS